MDVSTESQSSLPSLSLILTCTSQNASKNAGEMINKYQILFNRTRQAVITGELVEIITGATASADM